MFFRGVVVGVYISLKNVNTSTAGKGLVNKHMKLGLFYAVILIMQ